MTDHLVPRAVERPPRPTDTRGIDARLLSAMALQALAHACSMGLLLPPLVPGRPHDDHAPRRAAR